MLEIWLLATTEVGTLRKFSDWKTTQQQSANTPSSGSALTLAADYIYRLANSHRVNYIKFQGYTEKYILFKWS